MSHTYKLQQKIEEIKFILIELENLKTDITSISDKNELYFKNIVENSPFFYRIYKNSIKLFIIDLHKLLKPTEDFSISKVLDYAIINHRDIIWKRDIENKKLKNLKTELENLITKDLDDIKLLRDKYYAHNDKNKDKYKVSIKLIRCWQILIVLQEIFLEINLALNNEQIIFHLFAQKTDIMYRLNKYKVIKDLINEELIKSSDIGELQKIRDIIHGT